MKVSVNVLHQILPEPKDLGDKKITAQMLTSSAVGDTIFTPTHLPAKLKQNAIILCVQKFL